MVKVIDDCLPREKEQKGISQESSKAKAHTSVVTLLFFKAFLGTESTRHRTGEVLRRQADKINRPKRKNDFELKNFILKIDGSGGGKIV